MNISNKWFKSFNNGFTRTNIEDSNIFMSGKQLKRMTFQTSGKTHKEVNDFLTKKVSTVLYKGGLRGKIYTNVFYENDREWKTTRPNQIGDEIVVHDPSVIYGGRLSLSKLQQKQSRSKIYSIQVYIEPMAEREGGDGLNNDCLFYALLTFYNGDITDMPRKIQTKTALKRFLQLNRDSKVSIDCLKQLSDYCKKNIIVDGDHSYISGSDYDRTINLKLKNGHYTLKEQMKLKAINNKVKIYIKSYFLLYKKIDKETYEVYDIKNGLRTISYFEFNKLRRYCNSDYSCIESNELNEDKINNLIKINDELKKTTNDKIDLLKHGFRYTEYAKELFNRFSVQHQDVDDIDQVEADFLDIHGGLLYYKEFDGNATCYDVNAQYPSEMSKVTNKFPIKKPTFHFMKQSEFDELKFFQYGVYKCIVEGDNPLFQKHYNNKYTHIDLTVAKELNLKITLLSDVPFNVMLYGAGKVEGGSILFKGFNDNLYKYIRTAGISNETKSILKQIRNSLWGLLAEKETIHIKKDDNGLICYDADQEIIKFDDSNNYIKVVDKISTYKSNYARMCPFITSMGRRCIYRHAKPYQNYIVRIHTDCMLISDDCPLPAPALSDEIGGLKIDDKQTGHMIVRSINDFSRI
jgi:hypothetical protein